MAEYKRELYDALFKSYNTDKDIFDTYGEVFTLKRSRDDKDKDQDLSAGSDRGTKRRKSSKDSAHPEEPSHTVGDSGVQQNQEFDTCNNDEQLKDEAASMVDWFKKPERPLTPDPDWKRDNMLTSDHPKPGLLKITNLTQELLVRPALNLLKGTCKSRTELEYHFKECFKATTEQLDWHNLEGKQYLFDLRKPLPLILNHRGRHVIPFNYFINNDLEYLKGGSLSKKYLISVTKTKTATYEVQWIEDMVHNPVKDVYSRKRTIAVTRLTIMKRYDYGHLDKIEVRREDQQLYKFKEGDFPRLRLQDIEDMLLLLVQQKLTNLTIDERFDLNVALRMFTKQIVIQRRVKDLQLGVKSYQKKLNLTKPDIFRSNLRNKTAYTAYSDPQGVIYKDQNNKNRLMRTSELNKFSDDMLNHVRTALHDTTSGIKMEYLPKRK
ncbi:hypothetical protein Tco_0134097 [Tanacetum coccineum]